MLYLTTHSKITGMNEGNALFNDALPRLPEWRKEMLYLTTHSKITGMKEGNALFNDAL